MHHHLVFHIILVFLVCVDGCLVHWYSKFFKSYMCICHKKWSAPPTYYMYLFANYIHVLLSILTLNSSEICFYFTQI